MVFNAIGFDSPEVQAQIAAAFEQAQHALAVFVEACRNAWQAICEAMAPIIRVVVRWYRGACRLYLIPRRYRDTMARRKIRRYLMLSGMRT